MCNRNAWFAQINLGVGIRKRQGEKVALTMTVEDSRTKKPVVLPGFTVTFFDFDQNKGHGKNYKAAEKFQVSGYSKAVYDKKNTEAQFSESRGVLTAQSTKLGHGCDNPDGPMKLGTSTTCFGNNKVSQKARSVMLAFKNKSKFDVTFETLCNKCSKDGRNFLFSFKSTMVNDC